MSLLLPLVVRSVLCFSAVLRVYLSRFRRAALSLFGAVFVVRVMRVLSAVSWWFCLCFAVRYTVSRFRCAYYTIL